MDKDKKTTKPATSDRMKMLLARATGGGSMAVVVAAAGPKLPPGMGD